MIFFKNLRKYNDIIHGVLERKDGSVNLSSNPQSAENVLTALRGVGSKEYNVDDLIFTGQVHGAKVYSCSSGIGGYIKLGTDGLITKIPDQILVIKTADCVPLLMHNPKQKKVGAIHAGRKGIIKGIIETTIQSLTPDPSSLVIGIGPHIRKCCYNLKGESKKLVYDSRWKKYIQEKNEEAYFDLTQIVMDKLLKAGAKKENIEDCGICTSCQAHRFYSARIREKNPEIYQEENERFPCFGSFIGLVSKTC